MNSVETVQQLIQAERDNLLELVGTRLVSTWVVWNLGYDEWVNWRPVVLVFENRTLSVSWFFDNELQYQWTPFDPVSPAFELNSSADWPVEWRNDCLPELRSVLGQEVKRVWVDVPTLNGISFEFENGWLSVFNVGDENALANEPDDSRRIDVASGDLIDSSSPGVPGVEVNRG